MLFVHGHFRCWGILIIGVRLASQIAKFTGPTWDPPGSCRPQMGPMLAPWTLLSGMFCVQVSHTSNVERVLKKVSFLRFRIKADTSDLTHSVCNRIRFLWQWLLQPSSISSINSTTESQLAAHLNGDQIMGRNSSKFVEPGKNAKREYYVRAGEEKHTSYLSLLIQITDIITL